MEDVLALNEKPLSEKEPVVCRDEKPVVLHADVRPPRPMPPGRIARRDCEYQRCGAANAFCGGAESGAGSSPGDSGPILAPVRRLSLEAFVLTRGCLPGYRYLSESSCAADPPASGAAVSGILCGSRRNRVMSVLPQVASCGGNHYSFPTDNLGNKERPTPNPGCRSETLLSCPHSLRRQGGRDRRWKARGQPAVLTGS